MTRQLSHGVSRSVFFCSKSPKFIWDFNHTTSIKTVVAVTIIACPIAVLLNLLVITAVKTKKELKNNSNILLSSLATADLIVGAVSLPLTIAVDSFILQRSLLEDVICTVDLISDFVLYSVCSVSFFHLLLIAWERYVATAKCMDYKVIVTRGRVMKYARVAWVSAILTVTPAVVLENTGVQNEIKLFVDITVSILWGGLVIMLGTLYVKTYLSVRNWNRMRIRQINVLVKAKLETKIAYTTFWLTLFAAISGIPTVVVYLFGEISPSLRESSIFRWAETILQLNSLANPLLYFYRNRRLRKAALELLRYRNIQKIQPQAHTARHIRRRRYSVASINIEDFQNREQRPCLIRAESCRAVMWSDTNLNNTQHASQVPIREAFSQQQLLQLLVAVKIEHSSRDKPIHTNNESPKDSMAIKSLGTRLDIGANTACDHVTKLSSKYGRGKVPDVCVNASATNEL